MNEIKRKKIQEKIYVELVKESLELEEGFKSLALAGALALGSAGAVKGFSDYKDHKEKATHAVQNIVNARNTENMSRILELLDIQAYAADLRPDQTISQITQKLSNPNIANRFMETVESMDEGERREFRRLFVDLRRIVRSSSQRELMDSFLRRF